MDEVTSQRAFILATIAQLDVRISQFERKLSFYKAQLNEQNPNIPRWKMDDQCLLRPEIRKLLAEMDEAQGTRDLLESIADGLFGKYNVLSREQTRRSEEAKI